MAVEIKGNYSTIYNPCLHITVILFVCHCLNCKIIESTATISLCGLLPHFHKITHHWTDSINSAHGNPSTSGCITHSISAVGYSKHYTPHQDYRREAEPGREEKSRCIHHVMMPLLLWRIKSSVPVCVDGFKFMCLLRLCMRDAICDPLHQAWSASMWLEIVSGFENDTR